jgi:recombination protein RecR
MNRPKAIERMIDAFRLLPGIGPKMAERLSYFILKTKSTDVEELLSAISTARKDIHICTNCYNMSESDPCPVCRDVLRDKTILCVVETPQDMIAMSHVKDYNGMYFVLGGALSPLDNVGPDDLRINELKNRLEKDKITEIIIATDADAEGETTALYLAEQIKPFGVKVTRLGYGLPVGGDIEYADEMTLARAIQGRREM